MSDNAPDWDSFAGLDLIEEPRSYKIVKGDVIQWGDRRIVVDEVIEPPEDSNDYATRMLVHEETP